MPTAGGCAVGLSAEGGTYVVSLAGDLDTDTLPSCRASLLGALHTDPNALVIDLRDLRFMDSSGLGLLVEIRRQALDRGVPLALRSPRQAVRTLLEVTGALPNLFAEQAVPARRSGWSHRP